MMLLYWLEAFLITAINPALYSDSNDVFFSHGTYQTARLEALWVVENGPDILMIEFSIYSMQ